MEIDARGLTHPEPLRRLREALQDQASVDNSIVILVDSREEAARVKAFAGFTDSLLEIDNLGDHYRLTVTRMCNCG